MGSQSGQTTFPSPSGSCFCSWHWVDVQFWCLRRLWQEGIWAGKRRFLDSSSTLLPPKHPPSQGPRPELTLPPSEGWGGPSPAGQGKVGLGKLEHLWRRRVLGSLPPPVPLPPSLPPRKQHCGSSTSKLIKARGLINGVLSTVQGTVIFADSVLTSRRSPQLPLLPWHCHPSMAEHVSLLGTASPLPGGSRDLAGLRHWWHFQLEGEGTVSNSQGHSFPMGSWQSLGDNLVHGVQALLGASNL